LVPPDRGMTARRVQVRAGQHGLTARSPFISFPMSSSWFMAVTVAGPPDRVGKRLGWPRAGSLLAGLWVGRFRRREVRDRLTQSAEDAELSVRDAPERQRYEIWVGDALAGFTVYRPERNRFAFTHTEIDPAFGGRGLASVLIRGALDGMRARGIAVLPYCPLVRRFIYRHAEYLDLVPAADRARFELPAAEDSAAQAADAGRSETRTIR